MVSQQTIEKCKANSRTAQGHLYSACAPYVYTVVKSYIADTDYVKDIMQETFAAIFRALPSYDASRGAIKPWIAQITVRKCIDHLRSNNKLAFTSPLEIVESLAEDDFKHLDQLSIKDIERLLIDMPSGYKTIFMLAVIDEYPHVEIAQMLDISAETSRSQLHRAQKWIKKNIPQSSISGRYGAI